MKRVFLLLVLLLSLLTLCSCNKKMITSKDYDYAIIKLQNGEVIETSVHSWSNVDENNVQVTTTDGVTYLVNTVNLTLMNN